ncbi:MAG: hypothetical protein WCI77_03835 [Candidatus Omnitrophota bacterium]
MRKAKILGSLAVIMLFCPLVIFAQSSGEKNEPVMGDVKKDKQIEKERMIGMAMNMLGMMQKQIVATGDGGAIVLLGNKLLKYDKDLNLIKVVELKADVAPVQK